MSKPNKTGKYTKKSKNDHRHFSEIVCQSDITNR